MTAAKVMDIISRLQGCSGQAADAASAFTQVKMEDASTLFQIPKSECPDIWIRLPRHKWPKSCSSMEDPVVPLERNLYGHPLAGLLWQRHFWNVYLSTEQEDYSYPSMWTISNWQAKQKNIEPTWTILMEDVDLEEPTSFLDRVHLGCTQRECPMSNDIVANYRYVRIQDFCWRQRKTTDQSFRET